MNTFSPPYAAPDQVVGALRTHGCAVLAPSTLARLCGLHIEDLEGWRAGWDHLPPDAYLKDGGRYRRRRHGCFVQHADTLAQVPHRAHWQSENYNALHGGMHRWFEPLSSALVVDPAWTRLVAGLGATFSQVRDAGDWRIEAHQFRIDTTDGIGRPTPEGAHRDGVDFVAVMLVGRHGIKGGETRVFEADGPAGQRFTLTEPWAALLLDDHRVIHESTPIQPSGDTGHRDTLVLTYRANAFQGED